MTGHLSSLDLVTDHQVQEGGDHRNQLGGDLRNLGLSTGDTVLVHSSLRRLGHVSGGAHGVVEALLDVLGPDGTLVVPTFTANNSDPKRWALTCKNPVPREQWPAIRQHIPPFDPASTPSCNVGVLAEVVRTWPGAVRSRHPQTSFAAVGAAAEQLMAHHHPNCHLGQQSPLGKLDRMGAKVLLLGASFAACSAFHLAEYLIPEPRLREYECVVRIGGVRQDLAGREPSPPSGCGRTGGKLTNKDLSAIDDTVLREISGPL